jgi:hypothetical protein
LIGLIAFASGLGLDLVNPTQTSWVLVEADHRIHFLGWHMFQHEPWRMPPGVVTNYGHPVGTSIAYTDSIPLFAFLFKLMAPLLPPDFQYLGLWLLLAYMLQGVCAALLLRSIGARPALQVLGAALFVLSPPLIFRYGHPALSAHWLLLACLYLYFRFDCPSMVLMLAWMTVAAVAAATHPYLAMMVVVLGAAHHARLVLVAAQWRMPAFSLALVAVVVGTIFWLTGYSTVGQSSHMQAVGLGLFSMNALALVMPTEGSRLWGPGPFAYATIGQYEGYAYFGSGALLLLATVLVTAIVTGRVKHRPRKTFWQHVPLMVACVLFLMMALSPKITAAESVIFEYNEAWWGPLTVFRASGRMVWPVFYLLLLGVLSAITRWFRFSLAAVLLTFAVGLQAVDLSAAFAGLRHVRSRVWRSPLVSPLWSVAPHYRHLVLIPTNICTPPPDAIDYTPFVLLAGHAGLTVNAGFAARYDVNKLGAYCQEAARRWQEGDVRDDEMYVVRPGLASVFAATARSPLLCLPADDYQMCVTAESYRRWQDSYDVVRRTLPGPEEVSPLHDALEAIYRDDLQRPPTPSAFSRAEATEWVLRYLSYRVTGCGHDEAFSMVAEQIQGLRPLRLCRAGVTARYDVPPADETVRFRTAVEPLLVRTAAAAAPPTYIDNVGQAVWVQEYVRLRRTGLSAIEAIAGVRAAIHRAAGI